MTIAFSPCYGMIVMALVTMKRMRTSHNANIPGYDRKQAAF